MNKIYPELVYSNKYLINIGQHVFPTQKYHLLYKRLLKEKVFSKESFIEPNPISLEEALLVHTKEYIEKLINAKLTLDDMMRLELPYSKELVKASFICAGGTKLASMHALNEGVGIHIGGGFHHAFIDHGEGFCVLNDIAIAIKSLKVARLIKKVLVIDCDVHQGNGTAAIFSDDKDVFTFSMHQENNYPFPKMKSCLDIGLEDGTSDEAYNDLLTSNISNILNNFKPDLVIYAAGADTYANDQLGGLNLSIEGLKKRDEIVYNFAKLNMIPIAVVLAGGYAVLVEDTVTIHYNTVRIFSNK